ncbi:MAG: CHAT domain-containing tetratricopeptide repeat protein [Candidatus Acidiferrales bacterium]
MAAGLAGCHRHQPPSPERVYQAALLEFEQGDLPTASKNADGAYHQYSSHDEEWAWRFRVLDAEVLVWRGLSKDALALLDASLPAALSHGDIGVRKPMVEGLAHCFLQQFNDAQRQLSHAEQLAESDQPDLLGEVAISRGTLSLLLGNYPDAESAFHRSLEIARQRHQSFLEAKSLGSLGLVAMRQEHYDESIDWDAQGLVASRSLGAAGAVAKILGNLGWSYYQMGDLDTAQSLFAQAEEASEKLGLIKDQYIWLSNIGLVSYTRRDLPVAESYFQRALEIARKLENKSAMVQCLNNSAMVELDEDKLDAAAKHNDEALALERASDDHIGALYTNVNEARIAVGRKNYESGKKLFEQISQDSTAELPLRWQAQANLAEVYVAENEPKLAEQQFRKSIATTEEARAGLRREEFRLSFVSTAIAFYGNYVNFLAARGDDVESLQVAELSRARALEEGLGLKAASISSATQRVHPQQMAENSHSILLDYWLGADHSYLWVVMPQRVEIFTLPPAAEIDPLVQSYRQALLGSRDVLETRNAAGQKLYDLLVAPAAKLIPNGSRVTILPDGSLYSLNFETLLAPAPQLHYWIEDVDVSYANSLTLLAAGAARRGSPAKKLLLVGDAVSPDAEFPKLPQAAAEMSGIENYFPAAKREVFAGPLATPAAYFDSQPQDFSYIHFVAHGTASRTSPLDSAVILSRQGDNYKLYARDIIQHPLHADLVTISACHGEGVRTYSGEGLVGLSWAFLRAGAHGVIAALWEVNDNSTPQLMDHLYSEISKGTPPAVALRDAKLALLHSGTVYRRPFYWAPFQFYRGA